MRSVPLQLRRKGEFDLKLGALFFDQEDGRYNIRFDVNHYHGALHCGERFEVYIDGKWKPTRISMKKTWYLTGIPTSNLSGLLVRI